MEETATAPQPDKMAAARAAKAAKAEPVEARSSRRRISDRARERAEEEAAMIPTNAEEYRRWERAVALLKATDPAVDAVVIQTPVKMDPKSTIPTKNPRKGEDGEPAFLPARPRPLKDRAGNEVRCHAVSISGDDLAGAAPGSAGAEFSVGDRVKLTAEAAERLSQQGWVRIL